MSKRRYYRLPQRDRWRRRRRNGYIVVSDDTLFPVQVYNWEGQLISAHRTWDEAIAALERL